MNSDLTMFISEHELMTANLVRFVSFMSFLMVHFLHGVLIYRSFYIEDGLNLH